MMKLVGELQPILCFFVLMVNIFVLMVNKYNVSTFDQL